MKKSKKKWIVFSSVAGSVTTLMVVLNILANGPVLYNVICATFGGKVPQLAPGMKNIYELDNNITSKDEALNAANALNEEVVSEGMVLLKNKNHALPLKEKAKVSVFGQNSINISLSGSGSGAASGKEKAVTLYESLENAGFEINPTLKSLYENSGVKRSENTSDLDSGNTVSLQIGELPQEKYTESVKSSYSQYSDAAIVVLTRIGGESFDLPRTMNGVSGARNSEDSYLQLDKNEEDLLSSVTNAGFGKVIVLINSANAMELGFLKEESSYVTDKGYSISPDKIDAALWFGFPGRKGINALGKVLKGEVNPSGRATDTYVKDLKQDPTWNNFGDNRMADGDKYRTVDDNKNSYYFVDYEEGVYVGYRYYETRGKNDENWYQDHVVYPFGYGLSYTDFSWKVDASSISGTSIEKGTTYKVGVEVTNTGDYSGKDVVEVYAHLPYQAGGIEKPEEVLVGFGKTEVLKPGEKQRLEIEIDPYYMASYDYRDRNQNGYQTFELEKGEYSLSFNKNAHEALSSVSFKVDEDIIYDKSIVNEEVEVRNLYTGNENPYLDSDVMLSTVLSRSNWDSTWPDSPSESEYNADKGLIDALADLTSNNPNDYSELEYPEEGLKNNLTLRDMLTDKDGNYGSVSYEDERWKDLLDETSFSELAYLCNNGSFRTEAVSSISKPLTNDTDGPSGFTNFMDKTGTYWSTCSYAAQVVMASTWNQELIERVGEMVGNEGLIGASGKGNNLPYTGWYAPGVNIHRSAFGGRNGEYFSEDSFLTGRMAAKEVSGCRKKGVYCYVKHFAMNEQETHRSRMGLSTYVTEQAMREVYLRPFEMVVKEGKTTAVMSSFTRVGTRWAGGDYRLLTQILRDEWGFRGMVITDFNTIPSYMNSRQMAYAGGDLNLATQPVDWFDSSDINDVYVLRNNAKNILYTVANSNAMNAEIIGYGAPTWQIILIVVDVVLAVGFIAWGVLLAIFSRKKKDVAELQ